MFYVIHNTGNPDGQHLSQKLRDLYGGAHVADVRADDKSVPDDNLAGNYWTAAQVLMKLCDMYADGVITSNDTLIFAWFRDPTASLINDLNIQYDVHPCMFWLTLEGTGLWTIDNQEYVSIEMLADY
jgi:hypothetical protein